MPYSYEVHTFPESGGLPVVPGANFVSYEIKGIYVVYGEYINHRCTTLAIMYKDDSGSYLVGAEQAFLETLLGGELLNDVVDNDPGDWRTYHCGVDYADNGVAKKHISGFGDIPPGILVALSVGAPLPLALMPAKFQGALEVFGMQGSALCSCANFRCSEIEAETTWYGDT